MSQTDPDSNEDAARVVAESTSGTDSAPESMEAAWEAWSRRIRDVDQRTLTLLKAAFEAGYEAGHQS